MVIEKNKFYKLSELAGSDGIGLSYNCLRQMCITKQIKCIRSGKKYLISGDAILKLLQGGDADA